MKRRRSSKFLWRVRVPVNADSEEAVALMLEAELQQPISIQTDVRRNRSWATAYLSAHLPWTNARKSLLLDRLRQLAADGIPLPRIQIAASRLARENWAESWKRHFKPIEIGRTLLVLPSWSRRKPRPNQATVVLDPGLSFGTGNHPTTRFCLEELAAACAEPAPRRIADRRSTARPGALRKTAVSEKPTFIARSLVDVGCGSGILAIAACKLGYQTVDAFDFDPDAVRIASENAVKNGVRRRVRPFVGDITNPPRRLRQTYGVVCANLTADLLVAAAKTLAGLVAPGGCLVLAGVLRTQFAEVQQAFGREGFHLGRSAGEGEWRSGAFRRA